MDRQSYNEMVTELDRLIRNSKLQNRTIYLFGHCNATEELLTLLQDRGLHVKAILDNNMEKCGNFCRGIEIISPQTPMWDQEDHAVVCIVSRAYPSMKSQLRHLGFHGEVYKLVEYNSFAEYSLSEDTIERMSARKERGAVILERLKDKYPGYFLILCPFSALGDIFLAMSYLPYFLLERHIENYVICVSGGACRQVVELFGSYPVETYEQKDLDELIQACIYMQDGGSYIVHQDRPYVVNLHKALYIKCIPLETIYKCGVFGLSKDTAPYKPSCWRDYPDLEEITPEKAVIFAPYAKSVTTFDETFWHPIVLDFHEKGYQCFTNVVGDEKPLEGTVGISPRITEMQSVAERAGIFIGIRSGLCDAIRYASCRKIAFYPDYNYCDTRWKAIDMYAIDGWENIVVKDGFKWKKN